MYLAEQIFTVPQNSLGAPCSWQATCRAALATCRAALATCRAAARHRPAEKSDVRLFLKWRQYRILEESLTSGFLPAAARQLPAACRQCPAACRQ